MGYAPTMRPEVLYPLFAPITSLSGIGPKLAAAMQKIGLDTVLDLLWHLPSGIIDRRYSPTIAEAEPDRVATLTVIVDQHIPPANRRGPYRVQVSDDTGTMTLTFFHGRADWIKKQLPEGEERVISGLVETYQNQKQMGHPDHMVRAADREKVMIVEPVYPLTAGVSQKVIRNAVNQALERLINLPEWLDPAWQDKQDWIDWTAAIKSVHTPNGPADLESISPARSRLAYDELLANQLALGLVRHRMRAAKGRASNGTGNLQAKLRDIIPYKLTGAQSRSLEEISDDMAGPHKMMRLLQGDVGSGKTIVALFAMLQAIEGGGQAAIMAPTEILARQHFEEISGYADKLGISVVLLTGRNKGKPREEILSGLASGKTQLAIGTHALFQDDVIFDDLRLAVIDEQHRFGVHQRLQLSKKGAAVDTLVMTATPIPRTLTLTVYGDLDVSRIDEKPPGRQPVETVALPHDRLSALVDRIDNALMSGDRAYWVCPLVSESETLDLTAAEERFKQLSEYFGTERVGLIHGQMKAAEKDAVMEDFVAGRIGLLVATTVIEVGVNVPEATIMVIDHADRFGLAQLHQLRGRVGRGSKPSHTILLYDPPLGETAKARIAIMRDTTDGFVIAEEDLRLRGTGDMLGTQQSGLPRFKLADLAVHQELLAAARDDVELILNRDADLSSPRGDALRHLLYLFERDQAVRYWRSA